MAAQIKADLAKVQARLDAARDAQSVPLAVLDGMVGPEARQAWERLAAAGQVGRQRAIIRPMCKTITLAGTGRAGSREWDPFKLLSVEFHRKPGEK